MTVNAIPTGSIGVSFTPFEDRVEVIDAVAAHAEARGLAFVSVAEAMSLAAPIVLARLAERTQRIGLMTGVLSVWSRTPATLALTAAELQRLSAGRFTLGLGAGTAPITEGFHGRAWTAPVDRLQQTCAAVRALLAGERLPAAPGGARPLRLGCPPRTAVPLAVGAITSPSIRVAATIADQWLPFLLPPAAIDAGRELIAAVAAEEQRSTMPSVTAAVPVALASDRASAAKIAARWLVTYATRMGPVYPRVLRAHGYGREIDALLEANGDSRDVALPSKAARLADDLLIFGTYDEVPDLCRRWLDHADALALVAPFGISAADINATIDAVVSGPASGIGATDRT
jgi:alkanesulfonate monooxygenase SsuD/methylene tetrahydromethanopterin reductase-like flavin-dependent oxidoreductase (luciferase family)